MKKARKFLILSILALTLFTITGCKNNTPYIGENGNWWVNDEDLGVSATGPQGEQGQPGEDGKGVVVVLVEKSKSENNVDTYTIKFSDNSTTTFTVTNGINGEDGDDLTIKTITKTKTEGLVDTYTIAFSNDSTSTFSITNGKDGEIVTVKNIEKIRIDGLIDTYKITYTDGKTLLFNVTNGKAGEDGKTPYIGENGNWWIDNKDTGYFAGYLVDDSELTPESSGLVFTNAVVNGKAGLVVTDWEGEMIEQELADAIEAGEQDCNIVVPNYVGATPVIGIASGVFLGADYINSIKLSKNTVYLGDSAFKNCSELSYVDFNGCQLTSIPNYCFYGTNITNIELPKSVTKLGDYSFGSIYFEDFDYSNITYFGEHCLQHLLTPYVYLTKDVIYVGNYAFESTYVFLEHDSIPEEWGDYIAGSGDFNETVLTGCINSNDYIYSLYNGGISLHAYKGSDKWLEIPNQIDGYFVKQIGYGFDSVTENYVDYMLDYYCDLYNEDDESLVYLFQNMEGIIIPNTVTSIEYGSLLDYGTFIYIPESVNTMWQYAGWFLGDDDFICSIAYESTSLPTFKEEWIETSNSCSITDYSMIIATGVDYNKISYDSSRKMVFYKETLGYSLLACLDYESKSLRIPAVYNNSNVYTIRKASVKDNYRANSIIIEKGITKIQGYAFVCFENLQFVYIPSSVSIINAYGFYDVCENYYVESSSKPSEWDSYWAGSSTNSYTINYGTTDEFKVYEDFLYTISNNNVTLISYLGVYRSNNEIKIPRKIENKNVTSISPYFYNTSSRYSQVKFYIPSTITQIDEYAFCYYSYNSSYYPTFYLETENVPSSWNSLWSYDNYSGNTSRNNKYYNQILGY